MEDSTTERKTEEQYIEEILIFLYRAKKPTCNIKEIAEGIGVNQSTIPKYLNLIVDRLIKKYISGPTKQYYLTEEGRKKAEEILKQRGKNNP